MKKLEKIISQLEEQLRAFCESEGEDTSVFYEVFFNDGDGMVYWEEYPDAWGEFKLTVWVGERELPNVAAYLERKLHERIDVEEEVRGTIRRHDEDWRDEMETRRSICASYGWAY